ncbi:MAG TPA: DUF47 family protein [Fimbriimonas sp.]|nr:DUF47 family protein [Fimbriimonas sp.]
MQLKIGKDYSFYSLLEGQADVAKRAAQSFREAAIDFSRVEEFATKIQQLEHEGDELTHRLQNHVSSSFITPIDKEDLRELSQTLDDITDAIEAVVARAKLYRINSTRPDVIPLADLIVKITEKVWQAVGMLRSGFHSANLTSALTDIHTLENDSDALYRSALADLFFEPGVEPLTVIKWKEIYDRMEIAIDSCEDIAKIIGTISVKYA